MHTFVMPQIINDGRIDYLLKIIEFIKKTPRKEIIFDFVNNQKIEIAGLAILDCLSDLLHEHHIASKIMGMNKKNGQHQFMAKILSTSNKHSALLPVREMSFKKSDCILWGFEQGLSPLLMDEMDDHFKNKISEKNRWYIRFILNELMQNAVDHSTAERYFMYVGIIQNKISLGVLDMGVTIPAKLEQKYNFEDDRQALKEALKLGVSTRRVRTGGLGLNHLFEILKGHQGQLTIISRGAGLRRYFKERKTMAKKLLPPLNGTWCFAKIPMGEK